MMSQCAKSNGWCHKKMCKSNGWYHNMQKVMDDVTMCKK